MSALAMSSRDLHRAGTGAELLGRSLSIHFTTTVFLVLSGLCVSLGLGAAVAAQVTPERLLNSAKEPQNWLMYSGDYAGHRHSTLDQINVSNAKTLVPKWAYQTMAGGKFETTSLVVDGVLYGTGQDDRAYALD